MSDYERLKVRDYTHWSVFVHENQSYLGRCVIWCNRTNALDLADANAEEREELFRILGDLRRALGIAFAPDWFNYAFLGNETRHLHGHFIPRYARPVKFEGVTFSDTRYGHSYRTDHDFRVSPEVAEAIRFRLRQLLKATP